MNNDNNNLADEVGSIMFIPINDNMIYFIPSARFKSTIHCFRKGSAAANTAEYLCIVASSNGNTAGALIPC